MEKIEVWKPVEGYEGYYEVSNIPRVRSLDRKVINKKGKEQFFKGKLLHQFIGFTGYYHIGLRKDIDRTAKVHRLKAIAFIANPLNLPEVNHRDGNKLNNGLHADGKENLEWCTRKQNCIHATLTGLQTHEKRSKIKISDLPIIVELLNTGKSKFEIAEMYNISARTIRGISNGTIWAHITGIKKKVKC